MSAPLLAATRAFFHSYHHPHNGIVLRRCRWWCARSRWSFSPVGGASHCKAMGPTGFVMSASHKIMMRIIQNIFPHKIVPWKKGRCSKSTPSFRNCDDQQFKRVLRPQWSGDNFESKECVQKNVSSLCEFLKFLVGGWVLQFRKMS